MQDMGANLLFCRLMSLNCHYRQQVFDIQFVKIEQGMSYSYEGIKAE